MGTVYVTREDAFLGKNDERLTVKASKETILDVPLLSVDGVVLFGRGSLSPALVIELLERHIPLSFVTVTGKYLGRLEPEMTKNIFVRRAQWQAAGDSPKAIHLVRGFVRGKLKNYRNILLRRQRDRKELDLQTAIACLEAAIGSIETTSALALSYVEGIDSLRGLEGAGSAAYFSCFDSLILGDTFTFISRNRRPPRDPVNSLLSLGYALLRHDVQSAINLVGFDPYLGYLHYQRYGRPSLALDLMEEFRAIVVDAVVLNGVNHPYLTPEHFTTEPLSGAVSLTREGLQIFLRLYEQKKQSKFKHPVMGKQCTYQEAFEIQARLMAKYLMDETDKYPPLILK
ncbi:MULTISPECIES: type I-D CRISPR-associated endonuclease Cas1d [unclassified Microcystis]|jgi:CRISPR-associated protein Cas1|uniref:type I-D CRISPR-associated endonuclease Cas1d n=1 Tax=Microcystis sp. TaxID=1127 RepID=UPI0022C973FC|nr:type I-D CRISPR-associated endonuclease Cas1d [Microcystis sp. LE17-20D]MCZ8066922.1 type I-D CRISPR-associated endonuclease Cas1d [Microcystis sp. LE17-20D]MCZ8273536.1 type I-D CRISPR-associated endonuclease Cas1d [Microcystis sp. LE19-4.1E]